MKTMFNSPFILTQKFGNKLIVDGKDFYAQWGLAGHNGIDVIPKNGDLHLYTVFYGKVLWYGFDKDYGNRVVIWNQDKNIVDAYSHLAYISHDIKNKKEIYEKTFVGLMGNSGVSLGAHLHYQIAEVDFKGRRINYYNGFTGWINSIPFLKD